MTFQTLQSLLSVAWVVQWNLELYSVEALNWVFVTLKVNRVPKTIRRVAGGTEVITVYL